MWVLYEIVRCGSKCGGSHSRRESVPPRFGVCAGAGDPRRGAVAAAARPTPLHLSRSRRFRLRCEGVWASMTTLLDRPATRGRPAISTLPACLGWMIGHFRPEVAPTLGQRAVSCQGAYGARDTVW